jgi:hypothetical protein
MISSGLIAIKGKGNATTDSISKLIEHLLPGLGFTTKELRISTRPWLASIILFISNIYSR